MSGERKLSADTVVEQQPDGTVQITVPETTTTATAPAMSESEALKHTRTLMDMRETLQGMGIAWFADGSVKDYHRYDYDSTGKNLLIEAWAPIIQQSGIRVNPFIKVVWAETVATGPLIALMVQNRKYRMDLEELQQRSARLQRENNALRNQAQAKQPEGRPDIKKYWTVDEAGFFDYGLDGKYLLKNIRKERPDFSDPVTVDLLRKYNGAEKVKEVFNV